MDRQFFSRHAGWRPFVIALAVSFTLGLTSFAQTIAVKTNLAYLATTTPNLGLELRLHDKWSLNLSGSYNPFLFPQWQDESGREYNPKVMHWTVAPEVKYWFCKTYERSYLGVHGLYGRYNIGALPFISTLKDVRYYGQMYGGGLTYGYHWAVGGRWGIELSAGVGYLRFDYKRCESFVCGGELGAVKRDYFGPTQFALSLCYFID